MQSVTSYFSFNREVEEGRGSCVTELEKFIKNIKTYSHLNVFVNLYIEEARLRAKFLDNLPLSKRGLLHGMVVGLKDLFSYKDHPLQAASNILKEYISPYNATCVERLLSQGAIIIGHQNCDAFGMGSANENSVFGPVLNGLDNNKISGGSSGGSAVAIQMNMCHVSLGTDTGGSVRQPASCCGVIGFKPTYSRISRYGVIGFAPSLDTAGLLSNSIEDISTVLDVIEGKDPQDSTCSLSNKESFLQKKEFIDLKNIRVGYVSNLYGIVLDGSVKKNTDDFVELCKSFDCQVDSVQIELLKYSLQVYSIISSAEASLNLACYDGIRYGKNNSNYTDLDSLYKNYRSCGFEYEVKKRIVAGTYILGMHDSKIYFTAAKVRGMIIRELKKMFSNYNFIILPTCATTARSFFPKPMTPEFCNEDALTVSASLAGIPSISIPSGIDRSGMPTGVQIIANSFKDKELLVFSNFFYQKLKKWR